MKTEEIGKILARRMKDRGMTVLDIEIETGVSATTIHGWLTGKHGAMVNTMDEALRAVGLRIEVVEDGE